MKEESKNKLRKALQDKEVCFQLLTLYHKYNTVTNTKLNPSHFIEDLYRLAEIDFVDSMLNRKKGV